MKLRMLFNHQLTQALTKSIEEEEDYLFHGSYRATVVFSSGFASEICARECEGDGKGDIRRMVGSWKKDPRLLT